MPHAIPNARLATPIAQSLTVRRDEQGVKDAERRVALTETLVIFAPNVGGVGRLDLLREFLRVKWTGRRVIAILDKRGRAHDQSHGRYAAS